jgi:hypothetical protein
MTTKDAAQASVAAKQTTEATLVVSACTCTCVSSSTEEATEAGASAGAGTSVCATREETA